ncbi:hypothetical protein CC80DRAFT_205749 [Byssothecium circinans]|uniref:Uncharacterized protein n=1 Tax=Byssothecium circinans TaxID=147558 RepID=A0A6A5THL8_9PLEO|nr:hypothetical protein CC80DRAFT_205749 [Byssothecium circinans]
MLLSPATIDCGIPLSTVFRPIILLAPIHAVAFLFSLKQMAALHSTHPCQQTLSLSPVVETCQPEATIPHLPLPLPSGLTIE